MRCASPKSRALPSTVLRNFTAKPSSYAHFSHSSRHCPKSSMVRRKRGVGSSTTLAAPANFVAVLTNLFVSHNACSSFSLIISAVASCNAAGAEPELPLPLRLPAPNDRFVGVPPFGCVAETLLYARMRGLFSCWTPLCLIFGGWSCFFF